MKKFLLTLFVLVLAAGAAIWIFRYDILKVSIKTALRKNFPANVSISKISVDTQAGEIHFQGVVVGNPQGFSDPVFAQIPSLTVKYRMKGKTILTGVDVTAFSLSGFVVRLERLSNGRLNSEELYLDAPGGDEARLPEIEFINSGRKGEAGTQTGMVKSVNEAVNISGRIPGKLIRGSLFFQDNMVGVVPFSVSLEEIASDLNFSLDNNYEFTYIESEGSGLINGDSSQQVKWRISSDVGSEVSSLSSRIEPENVDVTLFKPYFDTYSPVDITKGKISGTIIFDMQGENIGSDNVLKLRQLEFTERETESSARFWDTSITDLVQYLEASPGETVFDFKIKGSVKNPRFYPGPNVTRAIKNMAVDKIGEIIRRSSQPQETEEGTPAGSDLDKALDFFQDLIKQ